ncbi:uncharacterized protein DS421_6g189020 [Arachis hypogaea]|nr:uncharacterized protein DS421_6g189020 [Arachis hypogaea]
MAELDARRAEFLEQKEFFELHQAAVCLQSNLRGTRLVVSVWGDEPYDANDFIKIILWSPERSFICYIQIAVDGIWKVCPRVGGPIQFLALMSQWLCMGNVPMHVTSMKIVLKDAAIAFLDFMVMIAVNIPSPATALAIASVSQIEFVNVKLATLALTVPSIIC